MENSHQSIIQSSQNSNGFLEGLFFLLVHGHNKIPNHIASAEDEIYVHPCLELPHISALKASSQYNNTPLRLQSKNIMLEESLNSPLSQKFGASEENDVICYDFMDSPSDVHKGTSTTTCFDYLNSASSSVTLSKGMFQCTWKQGIPHFVFFADDEKEVYVAKLCKTTNGEGLDYVYFLHKGIQKLHEEIFYTSDMKLVGKMNVSTTFTLCHDNFTMKETHFVLFGDNKYHHKENYTSKEKNNKGMYRKVSQVFKTSSSSKFRVSSPTNLLDTNVPPNFELAAIVFKEHVPSHKMDEVGGWGLKFLNKCEVSKATMPCESYGRDNDNEDCTTSMSIVIPAGLHGGPRQGHCGPSSLVDRWKSGGCCDCGGWDEGCPLTILQRRSSKRDDDLSQVDVHGQCKSLDLVAQDSRNFSPTMRMVNIHDGLYFVHFQPTLSALQSFSIAVSIIHKQSPAL